jgi:hypothetical protein
MTALNWWLDPARKKDYPRLLHMAINILSIPAMSAEPERNLLLGSLDGHMDTVLPWIGDDTAHRVPQVLDSS